MRFLLDQDVYAVTARYLADARHDVVLVAQIGLQEASDEEILRVAQEQSRVLVRAIGTGVIYLRILPSTVNAVYKELTRILQTYSEKELAGAFVVVEPDGHRFRQPPLQEPE